MERLLHSIEGNAQKLDGGAMFGNAPKALWERWTPADDRNRIDLACRALLVQEPDRLILFEAGIGAFFDPAMRERFGVVEARHALLDSLATAGFSPDDIDVVVLSHLHFDHAGGLLTAFEGPDEPHRLVFPDARYVVGHEAWRRACQPHPRDRASFIPALQDLLGATGRVEFVSGDSSRTLGPDYRLHRSDGHTPGMLLTEIPGELGPVLFAADLVPGRPWVHRSITMGYDRYPERLIDEKVALLDDFVARKGRLFFTHDPATALARVTCDEKGRYGSVGGKARLAGEAA